MRPDEAPDLEALRAWLAEHVPGFRQVSIELRQFPAGYSNLTYLVRGGDREVVLRRPPFGSRVATAHDMNREARVLTGLAEVFPVSPRVLGQCTDADVLGAPFFVMERVRGVILRARLPRDLDLPAATAGRLGAAFVDTLAALHDVDYRAAGLAGLGHPQGYVERQVRGWTERYQGSRTDDQPAVEAVADWLADHLPPAADPCLVHNDYKLDNLVLDPDDLARVRAVLDWEMATIGDPLLDLGTALGYWVEAGDPEILRRFAFGPTARPGMPTRREIVDRYLESRGLDLPEAALPFYHAFGLFKIAVIAQQIYYRYAQGLTRDDRFAALPAAIRALADTALRAAS